MKHQALYLHLFKFDEFFSLAQLFEVCHRLRVVEAVFVVHFSVACQLTKLHNYHHLQTTTIMLTRQLIRESDA